LLGEDHRRLSLWTRLAVQRHTLEWPPDLDDIPQCLMQILFKKGRFLYSYAEQVLMESIVRSCKGRPLRRERSTVEYVANGSVEAHFIEKLCSKAVNRQTNLSSFF